MWYLLHVELPDVVANELLQSLHEHFRVQESTAKLLIRLELSWLETYREHGSMLRGGMYYRIIARRRQEEAASRRAALLVQVLAHDARKLGCSHALSWLSGHCTRAHDKEVRDFVLERNSWQQSARRLEYRQYSIAVLERGVS